MRTIIGLTGYARAGKDSVADILVRDYDFTKMSFAGPLKKMLRTLDPIITAELAIEGDDGGCSDPDCCGEYESDPTYVAEPAHLSELNGYTEDELKKSFPEYRRLLQVLGTDCVRAMDPEFWINAARREILTSDPDARIVFTDCRFPNEADMIRELQADGKSIVVRVANPNVPSAINAHASEQHVGNMGEEMTVWNRGVSMDELAQHVECLVAELGVGNVFDITSLPA